MVVGILQPLRNRENDKEYYKLIEYLVKGGMAEKLDVAIQLNDEGLVEIMIDGLDNRPI